MDRYIGKYSLLSNKKFNIFIFEDLQNKKNSDLFNQLTKIIINSHIIFFNKKPNSFFQGYLKLILQMNESFLYLTKILISQK